MKIYLLYGIDFLKTMEFLRLGSIFHFHHFSRVTPPLLERFGQQLHYPLLLEQGGQHRAVGV